jgi:hypothetical protein
MRGGGSSTYARERLGAMLGLSPARVDELPQPEGCGQHLCAWNTPQGLAAFYALNQEGVTEACAENAIVLSPAMPPPDFVARCKLSILVDSASLAREGGGMLYEGPDGYRFLRAQPEHLRRPWTARAVPGDGE